MLSQARPSWLRWPAAVIRGAAWGTLFCTIGFVGFLAVSGPAAYRMSERDGNLLVIAGMALWIGCVAWSLARVRWRA